VTKKEAELLTKLIEEKEFNNVLERKLEDKYREVDSLKKERAFLQERVERMIGRTPSSSSYSSATGRPTDGSTSASTIHIRSTGQPGSTPYPTQRPPPVNVSSQGPPKLFPSKPSIPSFRTNNSRVRKPSFVHPPINPRHPTPIFSASDSPSPEPSPEPSTPPSLPFGLEEDQLFEGQTNEKMDLDSKKLKRDRMGEEDGGRSKMRRRGATLGSWEATNMQGTRGFNRMGF